MESILAEISWDILISFILAGVFSGLIAGLFGVGGGVILVPIFYSFFSGEYMYGYYAIQASVATSLSIIVLTSLSSVRFHYRKGAVDPSVVRLWTIPILVGGFLGAWISSIMPSDQLTIFFAVFLLIVGLKMALSKLTKNINPDSKMISLFRDNSLLKPLSPLVIGTISSMVGVGGGSMTVPLLSAFGHTMVRAVATSSFFGFVIALPATITFIVSGFNMEFNAPLHIGFVDILGFLIVAPFSIMFAPLGGSLAHRLPGAYLKMIFGIFLCLVSIRMMVINF